MSQQAYPHLLSPLSCGRLRLRNRMVMAPMDCNFGSDDGQVTPRLVAYYHRRARGGVGLIIVGSTSVESQRGRLSPRQVRIDSDDSLPGFRQLARTIRRQGVPAVLQLHHGGRKVTSMVTGQEPVAPSPIANRFGEVPRELSAGEIDELVESFAAAAARARMAGFDGVELHAAHGYLISQFLSPLDNRRQDHYGGSVENRARFLLEIVEAVRERVGKDYPLLCRLSAMECRAEETFQPVPGGITVEETKTVAQLLERAGVHALDLSTSLVGDGTMHPMSWPEGGLITHAEEIRKAVSIPVVASGRIPPALAEDAIAAGKFDLAGIGRALIADPELPAKVAEDRPGEVVPCIYCAICSDPQLAVEGSYCAVNPAFGREREAEIRPAPQPRRVIVAGGGPSGLEAARVARLRGHEVALYEAREELGGRLLAVPKSSPAWQPLSSLRTFLAGQVGKLGVELHLGVALTPERAAAEEADVLILATGAVPEVPAIAGADQPHVLAAVEVLRGAPTGERVVVIGGEQEGCETALDLAAQGREVTLLTTAPRLAMEVYGELVGFLLRTLPERKVAVHTHVNIEEITSSEVRITTRRGQATSVAADHVVLAAGHRPHTGLFDELRGQDREIVRVGDCEKVGDLAKALKDGHQAGQRC